VGAPSSPSGVADAVDNRVGVRSRRNGGWLGVGGWRCGRDAVADAIDSTVGLELGLGLGVRVRVS